MLVSLPAACETCVSASCLRPPGPVFDFQLVEKTDIGCVRARVKFQSITPLLSGMENCWTIVLAALGLSEAGTEAQCPIENARRGALWLHEFSHGPVSRTLVARVSCPQFIESYRFDCPIKTRTIGE